ncbi:Fc.00g044700.m01.CDS01 [Cosmosporella sp. VM-42]
MAGKMMYSTSVSLPFAAFFVSVCATKLLHLYIHAHAIPVGLFILYLPSFYLADAFFLCALRLLLRRERGLLSLLGYVLGCILSLITLGAASSQIGFYYETGGELEWEDAGTFASDVEGIKVLLSGGGSVAISGSILLTIAWFSKNILYKAVGDFLIVAGSSLASVIRAIRSISTRIGLRKPAQNDIEASLTGSTEYDANENDSTNGEDVSEARSFIKEKRAAIVAKTKNITGRIPVWLVTIAVVIFLTLTTALRPPKPYTHMSTTLPIPLFGMFKSQPSYCLDQTRLNNPWPLQELIDKSKWEEANDNYKGWQPGDPNNRLVRNYKERNPEWLPDPAPNGFPRYDPNRFKNSFLAKVSAGDTEEAPEGAGDECFVSMVEDYYNPADDPLRITNLDNDILDSLKTEFEANNVKVKHVALILMESLREELFPIVQGSDVHRFILESHDESEWEEINARIAKMTPNTEKITGKLGNFVNGTDDTPYTDRGSEWDDQTRPGYGGINIVGALTPSTASTKSLAASHCGVWPMPVDMFEEAETQSYQPCIPQVLDLFNHLKEEQNTTDFLEQQWSPAFFQAVTDTYDRQRIFDNKMGLDKYVINKDRLENDTRDNPDVNEINYFGFPETALRPYIVDYITNATANNQRMFMSHFTSTTHHPWRTPEWFNTTDYMRTQGTLRWHDDFNKYLNTIRFHDQWLGELMSLFDDLGIANETLVVFVGDHGQAFKEDFSKTGTYENGHISNFRVPISFRHPNLPRIQYGVNATSISILPTIIDLLINTGSLNERDTAVASDLIHDYEGQSLIRPYKTMHNGRRAWNFGIINSGGGSITITSADAPWRLVLPLEQEVEFVFTDLKNDPLELDGLTAWSVKAMKTAVKREHGEEAAKWVEEADAVARWHTLERKRLWRYRPKKSKQ